MYSKELDSKELDSKEKLADAVVKHVFAAAMRLLIDWRHLQLAWDFKEWETPSFEITPLGTDLFPSKLAFEIAFEIFLSLQGHRHEKYKIIQSLGFPLHLMLLVYFPVQSHKLKNSGGVND